MWFKLFITNIVGCSVFEVLCGVVLPEGKMRGFVMSVLGFYLFYSILVPLISIV